MFKVAEYESLATGRRESMFARDIQDNRDLLADNLDGSRVAIIGAAGSIGFSVVKTVLAFNPKGLVLLDHDENGLVEVTRELQSSSNLVLPSDFAELPIGLGSVEFTRYFQEAPPFDFILDLAAIKHVRSEKNVYCLMRMVDTNILFVDQFLDDLPYAPRKFFAVSSDKAVGPANFMGASKAVMEKLLVARSKDTPFATAQFANVAFSNGSLPYGFLMRLEKGQSLAAPGYVTLADGTREVLTRFFMSHEEAGQLCVLSCVLGQNRDLYFPRPSALSPKSFPDIARDLLLKRGYQPHECPTERDAKDSAELLMSQKRWPCHFHDCDSPGDKLAEIFGEPDDSTRYREVAVRQLTGSEEDARAVSEFLAFAREAKRRPGIDPEHYLTEFKRVVPDFAHRAGSRPLDSRA